MQDVISKQIIALKQADLYLRQQLIDEGKLFDGYDPEMEQLHIENAQQLEQIIDEIGYPTVEKVGKEANEAAWLVIQHAISLPEFMKKCALLLAKAVEQNQTDPKQLAYLSDRIAVFEGKPQLYGTQFDWNENGELSPQLYDDLQHVNNRRKSIGLNSLEEQTRIIRAQAAKENETTPIDLKTRKEEYNKWRKRVGWIA